MGNLFTLLYGPIEKRVLMVGLDNSGKTTILYNLKLGEVMKTVPTIGFNVEEVKYKKLTLTVWDIGGQDRLRPLWKHYYNGVNAVIYVIDTNDYDRIQESLEELKKLVDDDQLQSVPILIYANKIDLPHKININELNQKCVGIMKTYWLQTCCANTGEGLYEGLEWLNRHIK